MTTGGGSSGGRRRRRWAGGPWRAAQRLPAVSIAAPRTSPSSGEYQATPTRPPQHATLIATPPDCPASSTSSAGLLGHGWRSGCRRGRLAPPVADRLSAMATLRLA